MKVNFNKPIKINGEPVKIAQKDEDGNIIRDENDNPKTRVVTLGEHIQDFLNQEIQRANNMNEIQGLNNLIGKIETDEEEWTDTSIEMIRDAVNNSLQSNDKCDKSPIVLKQITDFFDQLEGEDDDLD